MQFETMYPTPDADADRRVGKPLLSLVLIVACFTGTLSAVALVFAPFL
jgi:hypothetical protein